jgi:hypothetical protein
MPGGVWDFIKGLFDRKSDATQQSHGEQSCNVGPVSGGTVTIVNAKTVTHVANVTAATAEGSPAELVGAVTQLRRTFTKHTLLEISDDIRSVPPLQREDKAKHYVGLWVRWELELANLSPRGEHYSTDEPKTHARLQLIQKGHHYADERYAYVTVKQADVPGIGLADPPGVFVRVVARLEDVDDNSVHLTNAEVELIEGVEALPEGDGAPALPQVPDPTHATRDSRRVV